MNIFEKFAECAREFIPEGITLLESDGALPLSEGEGVALFGRSQFEYVKSGTGSGGRVNCPYVTNISDELDKRVSLDKEVKELYKKFIAETPFDNGNGWKVPASQKQPDLDEDFVKEAATRVKKAVYIISRTVGESYDCVAEAGNWYLSASEEENISVLSEYFEHLIVLINSGNLIDMNWVKKYKVGTVAYVWQGGQEGGAGTVNALMGDIPPSGRLPDTIADSIDAYPSADGFGDKVKNVHKEDIFVGYRYFSTFAPERVLYPFGYGLGYTDFLQSVVSAEQNGKSVKLSVNVKNIGKYDGKDVVEVYYSASSGKLGKPSRALAAFKKTKLLHPCEEQTLSFELSVDDFASYDDSGASGYAYSYVLEAGEYCVYVGKNVRDAEKALSFAFDETRLVRKCTQALAPTESFERMKEENGTLVFELAPTVKYDVNERIRRSLPDAIGLTGDKGITLKTVKSGENTLDEFIAQFDAESLMHVLRGEGMSSPKAPVPGTASCFAGITREWNDKGVPVVTTCDGPSGIRMESAAVATCIPSGTLIAASWAPEMLDGIFDCFADEMLYYGIDVILAPGVNIHRNPLCGRNFEYFSEDPCLAGAFAAKIAERMTKKGVYCTLKHFAVNSQETCRGSENEVLSERALREIYLKVFEIAVRSGYVKSIMTSYNLINGSSAAACYDLTTTILRNEWGYDSFVMTDWWPKIKSLRDGSFVKNNLADMVKAQNDIYMCVSDALTFADDMKCAYDEGYLTLGELQRSAKNIIKFSMQTLAYGMGRKSDLESLDKVGKRVFSGSLEGVEEKLHTAIDGRWAGVPKRKLPLSLPENKLYCADIEYSFDGDPLEQHTVAVFIDGNEPIHLTCSGTNGKSAHLRFKAYLKVDSAVYFESKNILSFSLYELA